MKKISPLALELYDRLPTICWKTERNLASDIGCRVSKVKKLKEELEEAGLIKILLHRNGKRSNAKHEIIKLSRNKNGSPICKHIKFALVLGGGTAVRNLDRNYMIECYLKAGLEILPFSEKEKKPIKEFSTSDWRKLVAAEKFDFFYDHPALNVGLKICNHLTIVDVDIKENIWINHEAFRNTLTVITPHGFHFYFRKDAVITTSAKLLPDIDTRCKSSFVILPPSKFSESEVYEWGNVCLPNHLPIEFRREWRRSEFEKTSYSGKFTLPEQIIKGSRNDTLWRYGRILRCQGKTFFEIEEIIIEKNRNLCLPPLSRKEIDSLIKNIWERPDRIAFRP